MTKNQLETAIKVCDHEIEKLTNETLRPSQGFKMRTHGALIAAIITSKMYYKEELKLIDAIVLKTNFVKGDK